MKPEALVFDAYGTLFDVHSIAARAGNKLECTWLRSLMERYEDFWEVTRAALRSAIMQLKIEASGAQLDRLMQAYLTPQAFPEVISALMP